MRSQSISNHNIKQRCARALKEQLSSSWQHLLSLPLVQKLHRFPVFLGWTAGNARVAWYEVLTNNRVFVGVVLMGVGVFLYVAHLLFHHPEVNSPFAFIHETEVPIDVWYYKRWFYWFYTQREEFLFGFGLTGFFLRCPVKWGFRWSLVPLIAVCFTEIIQQSFFIDHYTDFFTFPAWQIWFVVIASIIPVYICLDYAAYRKYHLKDGNAARVLGVFNLPQLSWDEKKPHFEKLNEEMQNLNSRV
jgi:hypothetical protein